MLDRTATDWRQLAGDLDIEGRAFINGRFVDALSGETRPTVNPANGRELAEVAVCGPADADLALKGARAAFDSGTWSEMAPMERKLVLVRWAELIFVMEPMHRDKLRRRFCEALTGQRIVCLNIPDEFALLQPELVALLKRKVPPHLMAR